MSDTIFIKYENGEMQINLEEFLCYSCNRSISKVRKLVKIINNSYTPEVIEDMKKFIEQRMNTTDTIIETAREHCLVFNDEVKKYEKRLDSVVAHRANYKRNTDGWKYYNKQVKEVRENLRTAKVNMRAAKGQFNDTVRMKNFFIKLLSEVFS